MALLISAFTISPFRSFHITNSNNIKIDFLHLCIVIATSTYALSLSFLVYFKKLERCRYDDILIT